MHKMSKTKKNNLLSQATSQKIQDQLGQQSDFLRKDMERLERSTMVYPQSSAGLWPRLKQLINTLRLSGCQGCSASVHSLGIRFEKILTYLNSYSMRQRLCDYSAPSRLCKKCKASPCRASNLESWVRSCTDCFAILTPKSGPAFCSKKLSHISLIFALKNASF